MSNVQTEVKNIMNLGAGDVVHFHGARFEVVSTEVVTNGARGEIDRPEERGNRVMVAKAKWLDGNIVNGYFGPDTDWTFQGNYWVSYHVEK